MSKYKTLMLCYDFANKHPYFDELSVTFDTKTEAENSMYHCVIDELECLNGMYEEGTFPERRFIPTMSSEKYDIVVNAWDGHDYRPVTCYKVMSIEELVEFFNRRLREIHGKDITVQIHDYEEDNGNIQFYFTSVIYGESDAFFTASGAYDAANDYLHGIGEIY